MNGLKVYGKPNCQGCDQAKALIEAKGLGYEYVDILRTPSAMQLFRDKGFKSVPQIFFDGEHLGGVEDLKVLLIKL